MFRHFHHSVVSSLKTMKYHGQYREKDTTKISSADLVITTYHTLASDYAGKNNPMNVIEWYRLNRLEDIGSLFAFLRVSPFQSLGVFRKFIAVPFDEGEKRRKIAIEPFTHLLDSLCLRRKKDLLHLPDQRDRYEQTKKIMFRAVRNQVGVFDHKSTLGLFQVQLQLRILCNPGTYQQPFSWTRRKLYLLDEREDVESAVGRNGEVTCSACQTTMPLFGPGTMYQRYTENCKHVLCSECIEQSMSNMEDSGHTKCPLCSFKWGISSKSDRAAQSSETDSYFRAEGRSSKIETLMLDVQTDMDMSKSIIFSCWTRTRDLIQRYLQHATIHFQRIDGETPTAKREKILDDFAKNPQLRVLVMTTGTGAVRLNLATANRVFIVEPQWNPGVENQAIARALRLGQEQSVQVTRYVVTKTVEQEMRTLQDRKLERAGIAWE
ncbi:P-loop containing nucleoside triphosphate hydrolase protein [Massariosphaeria phaeospora]|uniref:P-loop containing nucleoside triphosphate hydrolase protein n=1 Tax=Massariosphaeria phaeospora TaxID=100035 RepID=A0A7C8MGD8_9PLEO|nr:P-loop containing nucleoside triphosphate hydrolase protein [Massariosphaeria phaeospora]